MSEETEQSATIRTTPGSDAALKLGCKCPVIDNHHGDGMPSANGSLFWISGECPIHWHKPSSIEVP